jgi:GH15 family glucan-1,4-alpha-glucosidase
MAVLDHAVIGNGRVLALVSPTGAIEWLCMPRFDSPTIFGRLLDAQKGGHFAITCDGRELVGEASYLQNTNVLRTVFRSADASWEVIDFAPRLPRDFGCDAPPEIVRILRPLSGAPRLRVDLAPAPNYGLAEARFEQGSAALEILGGDEHFALETNLPLSYVVARTEFTLHEPIALRLRCGGAQGRESVVVRAERELDLTVRGWRVWAKSCALPLFDPRRVLRSALCLKLHVYEDTGAVIAATTTSIPEALGTERTWDYRYCWLRDAAFVVEALRRLSHLNEGERFIHFLRDVAQSGALQPLYTVDGGRHVPERMLTHWAGFEGNGFVRIGNAAAEQLQHDIIGELVLCLDTIVHDPRVVLPEGWNDLWPLIERLVEEAIVAANTPDTSIWEFRTSLRHHTFSRAMCWAAIHRGSKLARRFGRQEQAERWTAIAAKEREIVLERGFNRALGYFTQSLDGQYPDASSLLLPIIGMIDARDPRFVSTLEEYERVLTRDGLMLRYANEDDFGQTTSAFTVCSFWWAEALALSGQLDKAIRLFERLVKMGNPHGLFSEDIEPHTHRLLGNFPQAYTHVGLIHAAMTIGELFEVREGKVRTWA